MKKLNPVTVCNDYAEKIIMETFNLCINLNQENFFCALSINLPKHKCFESSSAEQINNALKFIWNEYIALKFDEYWELANKLLTKEFILKSINDGFKKQKKYKSVSSFVLKHMDIPENRQPWTLALAITMFSQGVRCQYESEITGAIINKYAISHGWDLIPDEYL